MTLLTPLVLQAEDVLRAVDGGQYETKAAMAAALARDPSNLNKSLKALAEAGLIADAGRPQDGLTAAGREALAALDRAISPVTTAGKDWANNIAAVRSAAAGMLDLTHAQILPDPANARRDWNSDEARGELDALRADIVQNGLLQNLVVRTAPPGGLQGVSIARTDPVTGERTELPLYVLVGGERRWRAIGAAIADGDWPEARAIPCRVLDADDRTARLAALAENLQRRALNPIEEANAFRDLTDAGVAGDAALTTAELAERIGVTQRQIQLRLQLLELDEADQHRMTLGKEDPRRLSVREARLKLQKRAEAPGPAPLPDDQALILAEIFHKAMAAGRGYWGESVEIAEPAARAESAGALAALAEGCFYYGGQNLNWQTGGYSLSLNYLAAGWLRARFPALEDAPDAAARDAALAQIQMQLAGLDAAPPPGTYLTAWLNGPFPITAEGQAMLDKRERDRIAQEEASARYAAEAAAAKARWAAARANWQAALAEPALPPATLSETLQAIDHPLPWTPVLDGSIRDAAGEEVGGFNTCNPDDQDITLALAVAAAVNAAAGLPTPEPIDPAAEADDEDAAEDGAAEGDTFTDDEAEAAADTDDAAAA